MERSAGGRLSAKRVPRSSTRGRDMDSRGTRANAETNAGRYPREAELAGAAPDRGAGRGCCARSGSSLSLTLSQPANAAGALRPYGAFAQ